MVGTVLGVLGLLCTVIGRFLINGVSIKFPGIILGYYFGLQSSNRAGQILGIAAVVLSVVAIMISGLMANRNKSHRRRCTTSDRSPRLRLQPVSPNIPSSDSPAQSRRK